MLTVSNFKGEGAIWLKCAQGFRNEAAIDIQTGFACEECGSRLVFANLRVQSGAVGFGDVRRVADDGVKGWTLRFDGGEEIGSQELDAIGYIMLARVLLRDGERIE